MNYKNLKNRIETDEILSGDDARVSALLRDLKRVKAPPDFDFRLKAQIARRSPKEARAISFLPALRRVLPLGLVILIAAFAVLNSSYFTNETSAPQIAETQTQNRAAENTTSEFGTPSAPSPPENVSLPPEITETATISNAVKVGETNKQTPADSTLLAERGIKQTGKMPAAKNTDRENAGGSRESALKGATKIIQPPGINPSQPVPAAPNAGGETSPLTVREVLSQLGIAAAFESESWRVKSIVANSLAERSGVRSGDAVEAIDGERLTDKPLKNRTIEGKKLTIARGAERIEITLANK